MKKYSLIFLAFLCMISLNAQVSKPSQAPFEVSASLYAWDVNDEGIENMLDNLQNLSGVNSVYLISVMHQEHRPFFGPKESGPYLYPHNPARREWWAEDSRAYFHPHMELYGRIKPVTSSFPWLSKTDWLKVVVDAARKRGMKVGAEVSHTYIPRDILVNMPEYQQQGLFPAEYQQNNHPYVGERMIPCINNPEVQQYLKALYFDLASNYDIDFVQTCMYTFTGEDVRTGSCFCDNCKKAAKEMGFDLEKTAAILKDNMGAEPYYTQWQNFRIDCTTKIYKMIIDEMRKAKPNIDFRINDLNNRRTGLHLEDLKGYITSIHMSTHTEQNGIERSDRASRIETMQHFMPGVPVIPGIPVRILVTPEIVRSSIKISVNSGAKGIALKHYDGASFTLMRAVKAGLIEAGLQGFSPSTGMEVEEMTLSGFEKDKCLLENCVKTTGTGTATSKFQYPNGTYDIIVSYIDEKKGQGNVALSLNGKEITSWKLNEDVNCWRRKTISQVNLKKGDEIKLTAIADGNEIARLDYVEFVKK